jgi:glutamate dehydrogenase
VDPNGLDRNELVRLAKARKTISEYNKLSKEGYKVLVEDNNLKLPNGQLVTNGTVFRNAAHLKAQAKLFVPCGGRPEAIDIANVHNLIHEGKSKVLYIVEGANLYVIFSNQVLSHRMRN